MVHMALTEKQLEEGRKLQRIVKQYEGILRTSRNPEQISRLKRDLKKVKDQLNALIPEDQQEELLSGGSAASGSASGGSSTGGYAKETLEDRIARFELLSNFPVFRPSAASDDDDVNLMATVFEAWERQFLPALSDSHVKLDFSLTNQRESFYTQLENMKRNQKILVDTINDVQKAARDDMRAQLRDMRRRYTRHYLHEGIQFLRKAQKFWVSIARDLDGSGHRCMNPDDEIYIDPRFHSEQVFLNNKPVRKAIKMTAQFLDESIEALNLPEL